MHERGLFLGSPSELGRDSDAGPRISRSNPFFGLISGVWGPSFGLKRSRIDNVGGGVGRERGEGIIQGSWKQEKGSDSFRMLPELTLVPASTGGSRCPTG